MGIYGVILEVLWNKNEGKKNWFKLIVYLYKICVGNMLIGKILFMIKMYLNDIGEFLYYLLILFVFKL